jgi:ABC-2 type transport system ATP-binding protein
VHNSSNSPIIHIALLAVVLIGVTVLLVMRKVGNRKGPDAEPQSRATTESDGSGPGAVSKGPGAASTALFAGDLLGTHDAGNPDDRSTDPDDRSADVVRCEALTKRYGEVTAVDRITFSLRAGTVTGFLGPNGAGKTTTLKLLLGLAEPTSGAAWVFGHRYRDLDQPVRRVGAVLESGDLHPGRSGQDHLRSLTFAADLPSARVDEVLELVELGGAARRRVRTYSLGMRQRIGLAAALLGDPELLILDEPANGLDPAGVRWLRTFLRELAGGGRTVLVSSHLLAEVAQTVDHVLIIDHGRLLADAPLEELAGDGQALENVYLELTEGATR